MSSIHSSFSLYIQIESTSLPPYLLKAWTVLQAAPRILLLYRAVCCLFCAVSGTSRLHSAGCQSFSFSHLCSPFLVVDTISFPNIAFNFVWLISDFFFNFTTFSINQIRFRTHHPFLTSLYPVSHVGVLKRGKMYKKNIINTYFSMFSDPITTQFRDNYHYPIFSLCAAFCVFF